LKRKLEYVPRDRPRCLDKVKIIFYENCKGVRELASERKECRNAANKSWD
jgi:hypothetical protein